MQNKKRAISLVLAILFVLAAFAGCKPTDGGGGSESSSTTTAPSSTTTTEATTTTEEVLDFGGREFIIASGWAGEWIPVPEASEFEAKKQEMYNQIEEDLNITITFGEAPSEIDGMLPLAMSNTFIGDMVDLKLHTWIPSAMQNIILPMSDERILAGGFDVNDPALCFQPFTQNMRIGDEIYAFRYNSIYRECEFGWVIFFNKQMAAEAGYEDLYQTVRDGKWDWNAFRDIAVSNTKDTDGDGVTDVWGMATYGYGTEILTNPGAEIVRLDSDGKFKVVIDEQKAIEGLNFTHQLVVVDKAQWGDPKAFGDSHRAFTAGEAAMSWGETYNPKSNSQGYKTTEIDFGLVPMPKAPGAANYVNVLGGVRANTIMANNPNVTESATIIRVLAERFNDEDWKGVYKAYADEYLRGDEEALEMITEYIWPNTIMDYVWVSEEILEFFRNEIYYPVFEEGNSIQSIIESKKVEMQSKIDTLFKQN